MAFLALVNIRGLFNTVTVTLLLHAAQAAIDNATASNSREFFTLLGVPGVTAITLNNDISLDAADAPAYPVNLTTNLSIFGVPLPGYLTRLKANYIANKIRLQQGVTLSFVNIILSGTLRGVGQHVDLLTRSDGGAVVYVNTINHRTACLPFDVFIAQLASLPAPLASAGVADPPGLTPRNFHAHYGNDSSGPLCWLDVPTRQRQCRTPYISMVSYGAYNEIFQGAVGSNGGYNSFFTNSYGFCDQAVSYECLSKMGGDLCLAAALTQLVPEVFGASGGNSSSAGNATEQAASGTEGGGLLVGQKRTAVGLSVGLGGALLAVLLVGLSLRSHWHRRRQLAAASSASAKAGAAAAGGEGGIMMIGRYSPSGDTTGTAAAAEEGGAGGDLLRGSGSVLLDLEAAGGGGGGMNSGSRSRSGLTVTASKLSASAGGGGGGSYRGVSVSVGAALRGKEKSLTARSGGGGGGTAGGGGGTAGSSPSSSGATLRASSLTAPPTGGPGGGAVVSAAGALQRSGGTAGAAAAAGASGAEGVASGKPGLVEVEAARRNLIANAAKGGRGAPLEVKILQLLGQGSFGKVYKGVWHGTLVALKAQVLPASLSGDARRRHMAVMEAAISSAINHPAIVQTYSYSFRPIQDSVGKVMGRRGKSRAIPEEPEEGEQAQGGAAGGDGGGSDDSDDGGADYGHELLLVLEYCDGGSLRAALDRGTFHRGKAWPWGGRRALQQTAPAQHQPQPNRTAAAVTAGGNGPMGHTMAPGGQLPVPSTTTTTPEDGIATEGAASGLHAGGERVHLRGLGAAAAGEEEEDPADTLGGRGMPAASCSLHITGLAPMLWPKLNSHGGEFPKGMPPGGTPLRGKEAAGGRAAAESGTAGVDAAAAVAMAACGDVYDELLLAPSTNAEARIAASGLVSSSVTKVFGSATSAADAAAAAAAADRMALMYLMQHTAVVAGAGGSTQMSVADPRVGVGYAKGLGEYLSTSNITDLHNLGSLAYPGDSTLAPLPGAAAGAGTAAAAGAGAAAASYSAIQVLSQSADVTMVAGATAAHAGSSLSAPNRPFVGAALAGQQQLQGPWSPRSDGRQPAGGGGSGTAAAAAAGLQQVPRALRYGLMLAVASDVASGLLHLHAHGVVHGDVKASNVLLKQIVVTDPWDAAGRVMDSLAEGSTTGPGTGPGAESRGPRLGLCAKVSDFGLSTLVSTANTDTHISATTAAGSLSHMSPELLLNGRVSTANDVYAFGVLLFELFTGERAWEGVPRALLPARVALEGWRPVFPPHTPAEYRQLAERCWAADPSKRPSFEEVVACLRALRDAARESGQQDWVPVHHPPHPPLPLQQ